MKVSNVKNGDIIETTRLGKVKITNSTLMIENAKTAPTPQLDMDAANWIDKHPWADGHCWTVIS